MIEFGELVRMFTLCAGSLGGAVSAAGVSDMCGSFTPNEVLGVATLPGWTPCYGLPVSPSHSSGKWLKVGASSAVRQDSVEVLARSPPPAL